MSDKLVLSGATDPRGIKKSEIHYAQIFRDAYGNKTIQFFADKIPYQADFTDINVAEIACCTRIFDQEKNSDGLMEWAEIEASKKHYASRVRLK